MEPFEPIKPLSEEDLRIAGANTKQAMRVLREGGEEVLACYLRELFSEPQATNTSKAEPSDEGVAGPKPRAASPGPPGVREARPTVQTQEPPVTVQKGATYEVPTGKLEVTSVGGDGLVTAKYTLVDGSVLQIRLPMAKFQAMVAPKPTTPVKTQMTQAGTLSQPLAAGTATVIPTGSARSKPRSGLCTPSRAMAVLQWILVGPSAILAVVVSSYCTEWIWDETIGFLSSGPNGPMHDYFVAAAVQLQTDSATVASLIDDHQVQDPPSRGAAGPPGTQETRSALTAPRDSEAADALYEWPTIHPEVMRKGTDQFRLTSFYAVIGTATRSEDHK
jgi:hypothetical protein